MTSAQGQQRRKTKTWSLFGDVRRKPTPYEVVTGKLHHHFRHEPAPFEMDPQWAINQWYLTHREGSPLQVDDWEDFRDPDRLIYKDYVAHQHEREVYVDGLIDEHEEVGSVTTLSPGWVDTLRTLFVPLRFPLHVLQMVGLYIGQMAPSSYITNCAHFQAADELRRIQRFAYWTKVLANAHGDDIAQTATARRSWEQDPAWQPLREALEKLLIAYDWGEAFTALNVVVKPMVDALVNQEFGALAENNDDRLLAALCTEFAHDARRSQRWTQALTEYAVQRKPELSGVLDGWVRQWQPRAEKAVAGLAGQFARAPRPLDPGAVASRVKETHREFLAGIVR
ncbi:aromatic/alkene monooxygenase hydroxylase subunit beta [Mycobacterium sp. SM1]|uniref:aromatic/alkene monooxygenase hydroxylase subunit beta n=1 Tax=Mycobacterium sp. SM1 TaxID=2816243 RepID=UPI001BCC9A99|nr:aromatic/alkene monooxygenase hydroxylase subunit beta [Mycobacterium sp. SM1]MBS4730370.1 aromatic/alkene monooxygenase hydroxylase subunit beta [Mycobacterium sp. SM1]